MQEPTIKTTENDQETVSAIHALSTENRNKLVALIKENSSDATQIIKTQTSALAEGVYVGLELCAWMRTKMQLTSKDFQFL
jgi:hypothetical protein